VLAHSRLIQNEFGEITGFEGALENITERKKLESQVQEYVQKLESSRDALTHLNAQKDKILAIVSHDLRSPFTSILGFCELLKNDFEELSNEEKKQYLGYIYEAAEQQLNLVNSLLDWSRLETGRIRLHYISVDLEKIAQAAIHSLLGIAMKKNITMKISIPKETIIVADEQLLQQLFSNLIGNALKFTPAGGIVSIILFENSDHHTIIDVSDTGIGIPADEMSKLFKVEEKYTRKGLAGEVGTGLGLPMCYEIMKKHNGAIEAISEEGKGTTFRLTFTKQLRSKCSKILVVDDQKGNQMIISRFLERIAKDSTILFAENGAEAFEIVQREHPNLIISDYHMPEMDGLEFIHKVRSNPETQRIPIIINSGDNLEKNPDIDSLTVVLKKPLVFTELKNTIEKIHM
jgi:signal transduction histidine kinase